MCYFYLTGDNEIAVFFYLGGGSLWSLYFATNMQDNLFKIECNFIEFSFFDIGEELNIFELFYSGIEIW
jgi:hypothetical protein